MADDAFFAIEGEGYVPLSPSRGYWKHDSLHGRSIVGLLGYELERRYGSAAHLPARLTVDMHRLAPFAPVRIESREVTRSARLILVEADMVVGGQAMARATCQFLRKGDAPAGRVWSPGPWPAAHPDAFASLPDGKTKRIFEWRNVEGRLGGFGPRSMWSRERYSLIEGIATTPYARVALAADFASPYAHASDLGIGYINTDVTIHLTRSPVDEWIGFEMTGHEASDGIAIGNCRLHDPQGPIGYVSCTALANERRRSAPRETPKE